MLFRSDKLFCHGSQVSEGKFRIYEQFQKSLSKKENSDFLKNEYGWGGSYPIIVGTGIDELHDGKGIKLSKKVNGEEVKLLLNWNQVEKRISELIKMDRYLNQKEKELYPQWLEQQEIRRAEVAEERRIQAGMTFAIEPMINMGRADVEWLDDDWTVVAEDGLPSAHYENTILITDGEPEILTLI